MIRIPRLSFEAWSKKWKSAKKTHDVEDILRLWKIMPTEKWKRHRKNWLTLLGYRKNTTEERGEQIIERALLGTKGNERSHKLILGCRSLKVTASRHNDALAGQRRGQVIVDATGTVTVGGTRHPLAIEIKSTADDCWSALVQNLQQIRLLRADEQGTKARFRAPAGTWGMVLAPRSYYDMPKNQKVLPKCCELLARLKESKSQARVVLAVSDKLKDNLIEVIAHNWL